MIDNLKVGDYLYCAEWNYYANESGNGEVIMMKWKIVKLTPKGYHVTLTHRIKGAFIPDDLPQNTVDATLRDRPHDQWVGHNSRLFFADQISAVNRLIMRRKLYIQRLKTRIEAAKIDVENLSQGTLRFSRMIDLGRFSFEGD